MTKVNKLNHSTAVLAQITCQINSEKNAVFDLSQFLPYPAVETKELDLDERVMLTFLATIGNLDQSLFSLVSDINILGRVSSSYYWASGGYMWD